MTVAAIRLSMKALGYSPTPCNGKKPVLGGWQTLHDVSADEMLRWPGANTGSLCFKTPVFDIDITHEHAAVRAEEVVKEWFDGRGFMPNRFGKLPKRALFFRADTPFPKMAQYFRDQKGVEHKIEILCDGQQAVVHGTHPDTGEPYTYHGEPIWAVHRDELPLVTGEEMRELLTLVSDALVEEFGFERKASVATNGAAHDDNEKCAGPVNIDEKLASMVDGGTVNDAHIRIIPSRLSRGEDPTEVLDSVVSATMAIVGGTLGWSEADERKQVIKRILSAYNNLLLRDYDIADGIPSWLPEKFHSAWMARIQDGVRPVMHYGRFGFRAQAKYGEHAAGPMGPAAAELEPQATADPVAAEPTAEEPVSAAALPFDFIRYNGNNITPASWVIKGFLPETGVAILPGQWGLFKTTALLDMSYAIMTGTPFAGHYKVKKKGAVVLYALEGERMVDTRLKAIAMNAGDEDADLPFFRRKECPLLAQPTAASEIIAHVKAMDEVARAQCGVPVSVVWIDTYSSAAGHTGSGDDNDRAATQKIFRALRRISQETGVLVAVIDHYGKMVEAGTTGSSGKEGNADTVLANLGDRKSDGSIENLRMVVRKQRDGLSGFEVPFKVVVMELGTDEDGDPITATALDWGEQRVAKKKGKKSPNDKILMDALEATARDYGFPFVTEDGETVRACHEETLKDAFFGLVPRGDDDDAQYRDRRRKSFERALERGRASSRVGRHEPLDSLPVYWKV